jgi:hypothetical protein
MPTPPFGNYFATFEQLAYVQLKPEDGGEFNIDDLVKEGQVVEFPSDTLNQRQPNYSQKNGLAFSVPLPN